MGYTVVVGRQNNFVILLLAVDIVIDVYSIDLSDTKIHGSPDSISLVSCQSLPTLYWSHHDSIFPLSSVIQF